jgi:hypothetical protein
MGPCRVRQPPLLPQEIAEIGVRPRMPGAMGDRPLGRRDRFVEAAELAQHRAQVGERVGVVRPRCQGSPDQVCGHRGVAEPVLDEAEMVQRLGVVRLDGQHPAQRRGSFRRPPGAQMLGGGAKLTRQSRISNADRYRSLALLRGPPLLPVHRS